MKRVLFVVRLLRFRCSRFRFSIASEMQSLIVYAVCVCVCCVWEKVWMNCFSWDNFDLVLCVYIVQLWHGYETMNDAIVECISQRCDLSVHSHPEINHWPPSTSTNPPIIFLFRSISDFNYDFVRLNATNLHKTKQLTETVTEPSKIICLNLNKQIITFIQNTSQGLQRNHRDPKQHQTQHQRWIISRDEQRSYGTHRRLLFSFSFRFIFVSNRLSHHTNGVTIGPGE